jgi:NAD-dependent oxidoreductase involved in siderophore biosynthesis
MGPERGGKSGDVLFEFTQLGQQMRVAAIDAATSTEVVIIAPLTATRIQMQILALAKLKRKLGEAAGVPNAVPAEAPPAPGNRVLKTV